MATSAAHRPPPQPSDAVQLTVPAEPAYLTVLRAAAAGLAMQVDLSVDAVDDLRIAVDEAGALTLGQPATERSLTAQQGNGTLSASFAVLADRLSVQIAGPATVLPRPDAFSWDVLRALSCDLRHGCSGTGSWIHLTIALPRTLVATTSSPAPRLTEAGGVAG